MDSSLPATKKSLGQHWLTDKPSLQAMVEAAHVTAEDTILEIGPGLGTLTHELIAVAKEVIAVEFDHDLAIALPGRVKADNLSVIESDIMSFDYSKLKTDYKVVANIPYYLTSNLIRRLSELPNPPAYAVLLVQKEVAERVAAAPGSMSLLSVTAQYYWQVSVGELVPAYLFTPPPKVDSQILILKRPSHPLHGEVDAKALFRVVKAGFSERRKTLLNSLTNGLRITKPDCQILLDTAGIAADRRAQTLSIDEWITLYRTHML